MSPLNLDRIQSWIDQGRLDPSKPITMKELNDSRCLHGVKDGVKLLARGSEELRTPINVVVSRASTAAISAIEAAGGSVITRFYTPFSIRRVLRGQTDPIRSLGSSNADAQTGVQARSFQYRLPDPTGRKDIEYYRDPAHRGYLSYQVPEGHGPSLFFKTPGTSRAPSKKSSGSTRAGAAKGENKLW